MVQPSPYTPGQVAPEVPGRAEQLARIDERVMYLTQVRRFVGRIRVDIGPRGVGKTSLLRRAQRAATDRGVDTVWVTAGDAPGLIGGIVAELERAAAGWPQAVRRAFGRHVSEVKVGLGVPGVARGEATFVGGGSDRDAPGARAFERFVVEATTAAVKAGHSGLVIFVDEIQASDREGLRTLAYAWQHLQAENAHVPLALFASGLPNAPEVIGDAATFSERFHFAELGRLDSDASRVALAGPANQLGVTWDEDALEAAVAEADGYPYSLQLYGEETWVQAGFPDTGHRLTLRDVVSAQTSVEEQLQGMFRARWQKASAGERLLLAAMARHGDGPVQRSEILTELGDRAANWSSWRSRLIDKGLIESAGRGALRFTVAGFAEFVLQQDPD